MTESRSKTLQYAILFFFLVALSRFFYWQVIKSSEYRQKIISQTYKLEKILPKRGKIYSSDYSLLATNQSYYLLSLYKPNFKEDFYQIISQINSKKEDFLSQNQENLDNFYNKDSQKWITLPTQFTPQEREDIENLNLAGVSFEAQLTRYLPQKEYFQDIVGLTSKKDLSFSGYTGLESYYDKQLRGKTGFLRTPKDALGNPILTKKFWQNPSSDGLDLYTYLNREAQYLVQNALKEGIELFQADSGSIIVIDPKTAGVLAISSLEATSSATPSASYKNPAIADTFEPGSIFKPLVVAIGLDSKKITKNFICTKCNQPLNIGQYNISNWNDQYHPDSTLKDIIKNSDNIGMSYIIKDIGQDIFLDYFQKLSLDKKTGIDLQGESRSPLKTYWPEIDLATASFGQGFAVTQIQILSAFNTLANDGYYQHPKVLQSYLDGDQTIPTNNQEPEKIFSKGTTDQIKEILEYAVDQGSVARLKPENLKVCAKSGTAQVAVKGGYTDSHTIASYIGFAPCDNPKFTMIVTINNPRSSPWGASTAAPIWYQLADKLQYLL